MSEAHKEITSEEEKTLSEFSLDEVVESVGDENGEADEHATLNPHDIGWSEYVLSNFLPHELNPEGAPYVFGLRRVAGKLLGEIIESESRVIQAPTFVGDTNRLQPAVVEHTITIQWKRGKYPGSRRFTAAADLFAENCADPKFAVFPTAMASTRAEGRALRLALQLRKVCAEECGAGASLGQNAEGKPINDSQINFIDVKCSGLNVNVMRFVNQYREKTNQYSDISEMSFEGAIAAQDLLGRYMRSEEKIPAKLVGYTKNWRAA